MSAPPDRVPRASGQATIVKAQITVRERIARIIQRRELLVGMVRNELKIKYKNSVLGFAWSLLNPLLYLVVFYIAFTVILGSGISAFPIWLLSGLLVWNLFSTGLGAATGSVVANSGLVKKVSFPREILPLAAVGSMLVHFFLQSMVLFVVLAVVRWDVAWWYIPMLPIALAVLLLLTSALGILLSAINVYLRDTSHFLELALLAWFWITPIVYQFELVAQKDGWSKYVWMANPVTPIVLLFQRAIYARLDNVRTVNGVKTVTPLLPHWPYWQFVAYLGYSLVFALVVMAIAIRVFGRSEANFAEELLMAPAIEVRSISKQFKLYHEHYTSLKERVVNYGRIPYEPFMALEDVDFDVESGSTVGILGHNGCGKSTLLKCVAGILQPTRGEIVTRGRVAALLELGAGFNHELTGRENVFMNASILGLSKKDTELIFDEIVAFAELERFIDMQVRHYSSGMYVRLGFAVAVNVEPDILLVDEVLSVGDEAFQRKCIERVKKFQDEGRTILFVTHAADLVRRICDRAIVLDHGKMVIDAAPGEAVRVFRESLHGGELNETGDEPEVEAVVEEDETAGAEGAAVDTGPKKTYRVRIASAEIDYQGSSRDRNWLLPDEAMAVRVKYHATERTEDILFGIAMHDENGNLLFGTNTSILGVDVPPADGDGEMSFEFPRVPLLDGTYLVTLAIQTVDEGTVYDWWEQHLTFQVMNPARTQGLVSFPVDVKFGEGA